MNPISLTLFVACQKAIVSDRNTLSVVECVDEVNAPIFPAFLHSLAFVAVFQRSTMGARVVVPIRLVVEPPGREEIELVRSDVVFETEIMRFRTTVTADGFGFKTTGCYFFRLEADLGEGLRGVGRVKIIARRPEDPVDGSVVTPMLDEPRAETANG